MTTRDTSGKVAYIYDQATDKWYAISGSVNTAASYVWTGTQTFNSTVVANDVINAKAGVNNFLNPTVRDSVITSPTNGIVVFIRQDTSGNVINQLQYYYNGRWRIYGDSSFLSSVTSSRALTLDDAGKTLVVDSSSSVTLTVPLNSTTAFDKGQKIEVYRIGSGSVTIQRATSSVSILSKDQAGVSTYAMIDARYGKVTLVKLDTDTWIVYGDVYETAGATTTTTVPPATTTTTVPPATTTTTVPPATTTTTVPPATTTTTAGPGTTTTTTTAGPGTTTTTSTAGPTTTTTSSSSTTTTTTTAPKTVTYNCNGGTGCPANTTFTSASYTIPAGSPARSGYNFLGYDATCSGSSVGIVSPGASITCVGNIVLTAQWFLIDTTTTTSSSTTTTTSTTTSCGACQTYNFTQPTCNGEDSYVGNYTKTRQECPPGSGNWVDCTSATFVSYGDCIATNVSACGGSGGSGGPCVTTTTSTPVPTTTTTSSSTTTTTATQTGTVYLSYCFNGNAVQESYTVDSNNTVVQNINQACSAYTQLLQGLNPPATSISCSIVSMPAAPTNCSTTTTTTTTQSCGACQTYNFTQPTCNGEDVYVGNYTKTRKECPVGSGNWVDCTSATFVSYGDCIAVNVSSCGGSGGSGTPCVTTTAAPTTTTTSSTTTTPTPTPTPPPPTTTTTTPTTTPGTTLPPTTTTTTPAPTTTTTSTAAPLPTWYFCCNDGSGGSVQAANSGDAVTAASSYCSSQGSSGPAGGVYSTPQSCNPTTTAAPTTTTSTAAPVTTTSTAAPVTTTSTAAPTTTTTTAASGGTTCTSFDVAVSCCFTTGCNTGPQFCSSGASCTSGGSNKCYTGEGCA